MHLVEAIATGVLVLGGVLVVWIAIKAKGNPFKDI